MACLTPAAASRGTATASVTMTKSPGVLRTIASCILRNSGACSANSPTAASGFSPSAFDAARAKACGLASALSMASSALATASSPRSVVLPLTKFWAARLTTRACAAGVSLTAAAMSAAALTVLLVVLSANLMRFCVGLRMGACSASTLPSFFAMRAAVPGPVGIAALARVPAHHAASSLPYRSAYALRASSELYHSSPKPRPTVRFRAKSLIALPVSAATLRCSGSSPDG